MEYLEKISPTKEMKKNKLSPIEEKKQKGQGLIILEIIGKIDKINEKHAYYFQRNNKMYRSLAISNKREKMLVSNMRSGMGYYYRSFSYSSIVRHSHEQLYWYTTLLLHNPIGTQLYQYIFQSTDEIDRFLEKYNLPMQMQYRTTMSTLKPL